MVMNLGIRDGVDTLCMWEGYAFGEETKSRLMG